MPEFDATAAAPAKIDPSAETVVLVPARTAADLAGQIVKLQQTVAESKESSAWKVIQLALPVVLSVLLGLFVWWVQSKIQLKQEYYKSRADMYQKLYGQMVDVHTLAVNVATLGADPEDKLALANNALSRAYQESALYLSDSVQKSFDDLCNAIMTGNPEKLEGVDKMFTAVDQLMRKELRTLE